MTILVGCSDFEVTPVYNHANGRVILQLTEALDGKTIYTRVRRGSFKQLDCHKLVNELQPLDDTGTSIEGPFVDPALTKPFYGPEWASAPTQAMIDQIKLGVDSIIDVCVMDGDSVVIQLERDLFQAWDAGRKQGIGGKADDPSGEQTINSAQAYGERCVAELGEIPFFEKRGDGDYTTYDCLDSTEIPLTVTDASGNVTKPTTEVSKCDNPQYIYSLCESGPRVAQRTNDQGTRWVLLCRKSKGGLTSNQYNDIAMIGHNPFTGKTCFFQNALYSKTDGGHVPHPADKEKSTNLWAGVHGGLGSGIECSKCHDADPFIHSPWIDGAKDAQGRPIVPKMGVDSDMPLGANDAPYAIVNLRGQHWRMEKQIVSAEANACLRCHRMGGGQWADSYLKRMDGTDSSWANITTDVYNQPAHKYWMPPEQTQGFATDADFQASEFARALKFISDCGSNPTNPACIWQDVPTTIGGGGGDGQLRHPVNLPDDELAKKATTLLGMNKNTPSQRCSECHAANQTTLRDWEEKSAAAVSSCLSASGGGGEPAMQNYNDVDLGHNEFKSYGPFEVASGATIEVRMTGTGDADLYVKRGAEVSTDVYDCRPYTGTAAENCLPSDFNATGPAKFWVGVNGFADAKVNISIKYTKPGTGTRKPKEIVDCMRLEPGRSDSPFVPAKLGIYAAAAHLSWFQDVFKTAYPENEGSNNADTWAIEYGKFKNRTSMPKGNHPRFTQEEFDIIAEWFDRGLPRMTTYIAPDTGPTTCTQSITGTVSSHASAMATQGWSAVNRNNNIRMYGCGTSTDPRTCMTSVAEAQSKPYGAGWANSGKLRVLKELSFNTYYWMRSSADGRFVANGATGGDGAVISDLQTGKDIKVKAAYDPGFFPDNRGWMFQGTPIGPGLCSTGLLQSNPDRINFSESQCGTVEGISLYQHLGAGLGGGDYFTVNGQFTSDNPSGTVTKDPSASFGNTAQMKLTPMVYNGTQYTGKSQTTTNSPYEGDIVLSPSTKLAVSRFGNENEHLGYVLRKLTLTPNGNSYTVSTQEIARYCMKGAKPAISYDERFMVFHHYVTANDWADLGFGSANDPGFQAILSKGSSNIITVDLVTGARTRVTSMHAGQYALFPHFRSDGWIYFLVRDKNSNKEYVVASDAVID